MATLGISLFDMSLIPLIVTVHVHLHGKKDKCQMELADISSPELKA